ncbi:MAG: patatin-like phospholipase family protein [Flavobacteriaceae bacterium]|jgi:hypothetical protein|nr:patatin-like phospholipase family protein [Flavobacteriaceae bacterium]
MVEYAPNKYKRTIVFSGGGTRFGIYCGMFAAMEDLGIAPNLIIGACGGAIATTIINSFKTNVERKQYLQSEELYNFVRSTQLTGQKKLYRIGWFCLKKMLSKENAPYIENIFDRYLVDMPQDISPQLPSLSPIAGLNIPSVIIGSEILFERKDTGKKRNGRKLYKKVFFTDKETARRINCEAIEIQSGNYISGAVDPSIEIITDVAMPTAMRISSSDMFYVQPVRYKDRFFAGGAIDLTPIELAKAMAESVIFEKKNRYTKIEESLVRAVLGYSGNERLKEVEKTDVDHWIDTTDVTQALKGHYCTKYIDLLKFKINMSLPESHNQFIQDMEIQWQYGYNKVIKEFGK